MSIVPADLIAWAIGAVVDDAPEATYRAAMSRAYYGVYHRCRAWHEELPEQGHDVGVKGGVHQQLINQLTTPGSSCSDTKKSLSRQLGYALRELRGLREIADYHLDQSVSKDAAADACTKARLLLAKAV
jgi:uncharacterized protein (UPF0332 family)